MAYTRPYGSGGFKDSPDTSTPITAAALNTIDVGVADAHTDIASTLATIPSRNRIVNGGMMVDQRYSGGTRTMLTGDYNADRFLTTFNTGTMTSKRVINDGPAGASRYSIKVTFSTAGLFSTPNSVSVLEQRIEGYNISDLGFGTASPQPIVLSFYVKSSVTGTFPVSFRNANLDRSYVSTYTIDAANTWERKFVALTADTAGSWQVGAATGLTVAWSFGHGSTYETGTANQWLAGHLATLPSASKIATNAGATWQISGVQLEYGSTPTRFEWRSYDDELRRCQRYFYALRNPFLAGQARLTNSAYFPLMFPRQMRSTPVASQVGTISVIRHSDTGYTATSFGTYALDLNGGRIKHDIGTSSLTLGDAVFTQASSADGYDFNAEL